MQTTNSNHQLPIAENVLQRNFSADAPNQSWVGDITYLRTRQGWLYIALLVDLDSHKIVGWAVRNPMHTDLPLRALRMALLRRRRDLELFHHTDRGVQDAREEYRRTLEGHGMVCSRGRRGDCWGNAPGESVFSRFKDDSAYQQDWESKAQAARGAEIVISRISTIHYDDILQLEI